MNISPITFNSEIQSLLSSEGLPFDDLLIPGNTRLFGFELEEKVAGVVGVEVHGDVGLIRSLAVRGDLRRGGYGKSLISFAESWSKENQIECLYLLTTTAKNYFLQHGYEEFERNQAPSAIANTAQFAGLCPSSATFMRKVIAQASRASC